MRAGNGPYQGVVFKLIIVNVIVFTIQIFSGPQYGSVLIENFALTPSLVLERYQMWQFVTYMFLHGNMLHIFFNMYALLIFGIPIEQEWGSRRFLIYYFFTGIGAGISIFLINYFTQGIGFISPTIGASGAVFGLLLAFGLLYPDAELLLFFVLPIKAKYLVFLYGGIELYLEMSSSTSSISHIGHLGGLFFGILFFVFFKKHAIGFKSKVIASKVMKTIKEEKNPIAAVSSDKSGKDLEFKRTILRKLNESGPDSLSDDEVQLVNYMRIMHENEKGLCKEDDFNDEDPYCADCEHFDACFVRRVNRYMNS